MIAIEYLKLKRSLPNWFWLGIFLIAIAGMLYLGLNPEYINKWWWILLSYNIIFSILAVTYLARNISKLSKNIKNNIIGSRFTWTLIKIMPILVIVPVLSFYTFSFQSVQKNATDAQTKINKFNNYIDNHVNELYAGIQKVRDEYYSEQTLQLLRIIAEYINSHNNPQTYSDDINAFLQELVDKNLSCKIELFSANDEVIGKSNNNNCTAAKSKDHKDNLFNKDYNNLIEVSMSTKYIKAKITHASNVSLSNLFNKVRDFSELPTNTRFYVDTSVTKKRFLIDLSSTILLATLSILMIVFKMMDNLMVPLNNLSLATKEISKGNYGVSLKNKDNDMNELISHFNEMSAQIKASREGLDTHNLYLETILKYSYGVIALDKDKKIQLINPVIAKILVINDEQKLIGENYQNIASQCPHLKPLLNITTKNLNNTLDEWEEQIELLLPNKYALLNCQGATLYAGNKTLGYLIIIKDISQIQRVQKKAAWGEVAMRMAHEIKNPLTPILLSAQRLRNRFLNNLKDEDLAVIEKTTSTIINQVKSVETMVSAFADYADIPRINRKKCNLNSLIENSISLYDAQQDVNIKLNLATNIPTMILDANSISRVFINIIKNSIEANKGKNNLINISTKYLSTEKKVYIEIKDNGIGFDKEIIDKVFEPYVTTKSKGNGLGMAIVQNIIEQHDGRIFASNIPTGGALIAIEFDYSSI